MLYAPGCTCDVSSRALPHPWKGGPCQAVSTIPSASHAPAKLPEGPRASPDTGETYIARGATDPRASWVSEVAMLL